MHAINTHNKGSTEESHYIVSKRSMEIPLVVATKSGAQRCPLGCWPCALHPPEPEAQGSRKRGRPATASAVPASISRKQSCAA